jgi:hypothetical protein
MGLIHMHVAQCLYVRYQSARCTILYTPPCYLRIERVPLVNIQRAGDIISESSCKVCEVAMCGERLEEPLCPNTRLPKVAVVSCNRDFAKSHEMISWPDLACEWPWLDHFVAPLVAVWRGFIWFYVLFR